MGTSIAWFWTENHLTPAKTSKYSCIASLWAFRKKGQIKFQLKFTEKNSEILELFVHWLLTNSGTDKTYWIGGLSLRPAG